MGKIAEGEKAGGEKSSMTENNMQCKPVFSDQILLLTSRIFFTHFFLCIQEMKRFSEDWSHFIQMIQRTEYGSLNTVIYFGKKFAS